MGTVTIDIDRPVEHVWSGLIDAERYPDWLIGAERVEAPPGWPRPGATFEHRIGFGPLQIPGSTTVRENDGRSRLRLAAGMGPLGEADVTFELLAIGDGQTRLRMTEEPRAGAVRLMGRIARPIVERAIDARNDGSLRRLQDLLEN